MGFSELRNLRMKKMLFAQKHSRQRTPGSGLIRQQFSDQQSEPSLRILHVEDNANDAELVAGLLQQEGIKAEIECVQTRSDFLSALKGPAFDVILSDFSLPSFDGNTALTLAQEKCPAIPFLFVSGTLGEDAAIESLKNGATDYVVKNRLNRLGPAIKRALREKQEQSQRREAEEDLRRNAELFRQITASVTDLIAVLDVEGQWLYTSPSYRSILQESALSPAWMPLAKFIRRTASISASCSGP
jgi:CheY-like chemotaxis protein